jgi:hypothetical protein
MQGNCHKIAGGCEKTFVKQLKDARTKPVVTAEGCTETVIKQLEDARKLSKKCWRMQGDCRKTAGKCQETVVQELEDVRKLS